MIVALEGAPATGKTTIGAYVARHRSGVCIEEVNKIFKRPNPEPENWYYERQLDRLSKAKTDDSQRELVVLSGDPYQPIWFSWLFPDLGFEPWDVVLNFFDERRDLGIMPDFFGFTHVNESERYRRLIIREQARGHSRARAEAKHHRYQPMVAPQRAYFEALGDEFPGFVLMLETSRLESSVTEIQHHRPNTPDIHHMFSFMGDWFDNHAPGAFNTL